MMLSSFLVCALLANGLFWVAPTLFTDWRVRDSAVFIPGGRVVSGRCSDAFVINSCNLVLAAPAGSGRVTRTVHYAFVSLTLSQTPARIVADPKRPEWLTTDLGLDHLGERTRTLLLLLMLMLMAGLLGAGAWIIVRGCRAGASWRRMRRAEMVPVALTLTAMRKAGVRAVWTVRADDGRTAEWIVWGWAKPFNLDGDPWLVLGLRVAGGAAIMPLDAALRWVKLSRAERTTVLHAAARVTA